MPVPVALPSFAAGELSPALHGRVDIAKYQVGLATCLNFFIHPFGGASTRAGTAFVGEVYDSTVRSRLIGFQFNTTQTYVLEFADLRMRVIKDGGYVLEASGAITGITLANPGVVTQVAHGYATGDHIWLDAIVGTTQLNRRQVTITVLTANTYSIGIDTTAYTAWASAGTGARFYTIVTPYVAADLALLKFVQSADTMTITHPTYAPRNLTRTGHTAWTLTAITYAPSQPAPTALVSSAAGLGQSYVVTAQNDTTGEESLQSAVVTSTTQTSTITWTDAAGATTYSVYKLKNGIYGFIGTAGLGVTGFTDATIVPAAADTPPQQRNPFSGATLYPGCSTYHEGRQWYARTDTKPQTLFASGSANFANMAISQPSKDSDAITRTIASREVNEIRFLLSFNILLLFTSGAVWKAWAGSQADVITPANCSVKPQSYEGVANIPPIATESAALYVTASGKKVRDVAYEFASDSFQGRNLSILAGHLFEGKTIEEWTYARDPDGIVWCVRSDGVLLGFTYLKEHDVYAWSRHTTDGTVESVAAIQENNVTILYLSIKRTIGGVTKRYVERMASRYFPSIQDTWCVDSGYSYDGRNTDSTRTLVISGASFDAGDTVTLTAVGFTPFSATSIGQKYILREGQVSITVTVTAYTDSTHVTGTLDYAALVTPAQLIFLNSTGGVLQFVNNVGGNLNFVVGTWPVTADWALATDTLSGLWHLEGQTVAIVADGSVQPSQAVTNGQITVQRAAARIVAGLPYTCDLETLDIEQGQPTLQGRYKTVQEVVIRLKDSRGLSAGPDSTRLVEIKERSTENYGYPTILSTGDERVLLDPSWNGNGRVFIRQSYPMPATVVALFPRLEVGA